MIERQADHNLLVEGTQAVLTAHYSRTGFHSAAGGCRTFKKHNGYFQTVDRDCISYDN